MKKQLLALGAAAALLVSAAQATPISLEFDITGSNFALQFGPASPAPLDPLTIDFSITFDNATDVASTTAGLTINSFNLPYLASYAYNAAVDTLIVATNPEIFGCVNTASTFCLFIGAFSTAPNVYLVEQSTASGGFWVAQAVESTSGPTAIPEPGVLALIGLGLSGLALVRRRR